MVLTILRAEWCLVQTSRRSKVVSFRIPNVLSSECCLAQTALSSEWCLTHTGFSLEWCLVHTGLSLEWYLVRTDFGSETCYAQPSPSSEWCFWFLLVVVQMVLSSA